MQYLVDRDFIANDIYQGRALPMLTNVSPLDYDQLTIFPVVSAANIRYDAELAKQQIDAAMEAAGATLGRQSSGPSTAARSRSRSSPGSRTSGATSATWCARRWRGSASRCSRSTSSSARRRWPSTPATRRPSSGTSTPKAGAAARRCATTTPASTSSPRRGSATCRAGRKSASGSTRTRARHLGKRLFRGEFASQEERDELYQEMIQLGARRVGPRLARDRAAELPGPHRGREPDRGPRERSEATSLPCAARTSRAATDIRVGNLWVWTERTTWNPVGGFGDVYSSDIYRNLVDPPIDQPSVHRASEAVPGRLHGRDRRSRRHAGGARAER